MYQLHDYLRMIRDEARMATFEAALRKVIRPGDVVLDIGAGTGVLSFIALDAGAARAYALERSPVIEVGRKIADANGLAGRVTFIQGDARLAVPVEKVDCLVGDVRGTLPLLEDNIDVFETVRDRWLRPGGATIPLEDQMFVAPVSARVPHERVVGWSQPRPEASYHAARHFAANAFARTSLAKDELLAGEQPFGSIRYGDETPRKLGKSMRFVIEKDASLTGLGAWFRGTLAAGITIDTSPSSPPTIYAQCFFPLSEARPVRAGDQIAVEIGVYRTGAEPIWTWRVESVDPPSPSPSSSPPTTWRERHSTLDGTPLGLNALSLLDGSRLPALSDEGRVARVVLAAIDGKTSARDVAARVASDLPDRFASVDDALPVVLKLLGRYTLP